MKDNNLSNLTVNENAMADHIAQFPHSIQYSPNVSDTYSCGSAEGIS